MEGVLLNYWITPIVKSGKKLPIVTTIKELVCEHVTGVSLVIKEIQGLLMNCIVMIKNAWKR